MHSVSFTMQRPALSRVSMALEGYLADYDIFTLTIHCNISFWFKRSPAALTLDFLKKAGVADGATLPPSSAHAATVPGAAAAWVDTVQRFGSGKLDMATILQPAIDLAENGYVRHLSGQLQRKRY